MVALLMSRLETLVGYPERKEICESMLDTKIVCAGSFITV